MRTAGKRSRPGASCSTRYVTWSESEQSSSTMRTVSAPKSTSACPGSGVSSGPSATTSSTGRSSASKRSRILSSSSGRKIAIVLDVLPHVERRRLGTSDLEITPVGVGTAPIGSRPGVWSVNWGTQDEGDAVRAIHVALDAGGKVRRGGLSNHGAPEIERALSVGPVASLQHQYSALVRDVEDEILPLALARSLGVIVWSPLASGFLTDGFDVDALDDGDFRRTHPFASLDLTDLRAELRRETGSVTAGAIRFVLRHPAVTGAIVGVRDEREGRDLGFFA